jgi:hypothetical protein
VTILATFRYKCIAKRSTRSLREFRVVSFASGKLVLISPNTIRPPARSTFLPCLAVLSGASCRRVEVATIERLMQLFGDASISLVDSKEDLALESLSRLCYWHPRVMDMNQPPAVRRFPVHLSLSPVRGNR